MNEARFNKIVARYPKLRVAVIGDLCLDRYLEIDLTKSEISIETGLQVYNVVNVRNQPGGAGTIINNLVNLGVGEIDVVGFAGEDGEGWELSNALRKTRCVRLDHFFQTPERRTFTYAKPLVVESGKPPKQMRKPPRAKSSPPIIRLKPGKQPTELNRLDFKNWTSTPDAVVNKISKSIRELADKVDAFILLDQVDHPETGVLTSEVLRLIGSISEQHPDLLIMADSRTSLGRFPPVCFKMNGVELSRSLGSEKPFELKDIHAKASTLAKQYNQRVFVTLAECGIVGAMPTGEVEHVPAVPTRGEIDIVGAGDSVTANLVTAMLGGANLRETLEIANAAASVVIHKLGTTGTANPEEVRHILNSYK